MARESSRFLSAILTLITKAEFLKKGSDFITAAHRRRGLGGGGTSPRVPKWTAEKAKNKAVKQKVLALVAGTAAKGCQLLPLFTRKVGDLSTMTAWRGVQLVPRFPVTATITFFFLMEGSFLF